MFKTLYKALNQARLPLSLFDVQNYLVVKKRKPKQAKNIRIFGRSIDERPDIVNLNFEIGHWEIDNIYHIIDLYKYIVYYLYSVILLV